MDRANAPELPAHEGIWDSLNVWCDFCEDYHTHQKPYGHRTAHCKSRESPYYENGYVLVPAPKEA